MKQLISLKAELCLNNKYSVPNRIDSVNHTSIGHAQTSSYLPDFLCFGASLSANESVGIPLGVALMEIATVDFETSGCVTSLSSYVTALENADCTSNVLTFSSSLLNSSSTYGSSMASAYGDRQIGTRMNESDNLWRRQCSL